MFVCMYVCIYVCMYVCISVTLKLHGRSFCGLIPRLLATWYWPDQEAIERSCACKSQNGAGSDQEAIDVVTVTSLLGSNLCALYSLCIDPVWERGRQIRTGH